MTPHQPLVYKVATEAREFEMIHALNYRTFVEEIPQHAANAARKLVDRFHAENTYVVCLAGGALAGMVALRGRRPFSLDEKLPDLQSHLPAERRPCEIRLLAVEAKYRKSSVFAGLVLRLLQVARARGYDLAVISGATRQLKLYRHLGFEPFGPLVGRPGAEYQPMMLTLERFESRVGALLEEQGGERDALSFLPGPVEIALPVGRKFAARAVSHRSESFARLLREVQDRLRALTSARHAAILLGSGTLANDVVGGQLSRTPGRGLVLSNGEFGDRLIDHARRWQLAFDACRREWGAPFDPEELSVRLRAKPAWLWFVHCETSTGMLNDLAGIGALCERAGTEVCVDAISSIGTVPVDLRNVAFASAVSGKGLGAYPGLAIVLHRDTPAPRGAPLPRYLDLRLYIEDDAVPFTHSSNLLAALAAGLERIGKARYETLQQDSNLLRSGLDAAGFACVAPAAHASPAVATIALPAQLSSADAGKRLAACGFSIAYNSRYLLERNWIQIALMGAYSRPALLDLVSALEKECLERPVHSLAR